MAYNMESLDIENERNPFLSTPQKKIDDAIEDIKNVHLNSKTGKFTVEGSILLDAVQRYASSNIPADYWFREMHNFTGDKKLAAAYEDYAKDIRGAYKKGLSYCFAGAHGLGKSLVCACILKRVVETGRYNSLFVNLVDIVNLMASSASSDKDDKSEARRILLTVDFLVIDEFDSRFMGTDNAADLFGRMLEPILRSRIQNNLPIIFCTNSLDPAASFNGPLKQSFTSLMKKVQTVIALGKDHR